jgi:hypothetical protein
MSGVQTYVQARYPRGRRWVTVASSETRAAARVAAARAYRDCLDSRGETPIQVRIVSAAQLVREGGQREPRIADAAIALRADLSR